MEDGAVNITMRQASKELGVKARTLRSYCNKGLVPGLIYPTFGRPMVFAPEQLDWLRQAVYLSRAGFSTKDLRKYVRLAQQKDEMAAAERCAMLRTHKRQAWQELEDLQVAIDFIERQEELLDDGRHC